MDKSDVRSERNKRAVRLEELKSVFLFNEKKQVFTKEEMECIQREFLAQHKVKHALRTRPSYVVSRILNNKINKVLKKIKTK